MLTGRCGCGAVTYRMTSQPLVTHCCHCKACQRQTGSAYVLNALIEADRVEIDGPVSEHRLETPSGKGQLVTRCRECGVAVCSDYLIRQGKLCFIRVGTLDDPSACPPDVQIFTASKQPWVPLHPDIPVFEEFYSFSEVWSPDALNRSKVLFSG